MDYADVDEELEYWARRHDLLISKEFAGKQRRFCYMSPNGVDTYQISVEPPEGAVITVNAWSVESISDSDMHRSWKVGLSEFGAALDEAFDQIQAWSRVS